MRAKTQFCYGGDTREQPREKKNLNEPNKIQFLYKTLKHDAIGPNFSSIT